MSKKTNYFSHDSNARNDSKIIALRMQLGAEGYGIYFMVIERLREEAGYTSVKDYNMIAFDLRVDASLVKQVVEDFGLFAFTENGECFYSESLLRRMEFMEETNEAKSRAGKRGAAKRWKENSTAIAQPSKNNSTAIAQPSNFDSKPMALPSKKIAIKQIKQIKQSKVNDNNDNKEKAMHSDGLIQNGQKLQEVSTFYQENFGIVNGFIQESLIHWSNELSPELVIKAMKIAIENNVKKYKYFNEILKNWVDKGVKTIEDVNALEIEFQNNKTKKQSNMRRAPEPEWLNYDKKTTNQDNGQDSNSSPDELKAQLKTLFGKDG